MNNCENCRFKGQWCEKENKCPLFKEEKQKDKKMITLKGNKTYDAITHNRE